MAAFTPETFRELLEQPRFTESVGAVAVHANETGHEAGFIVQGPYPAQIFAISCSGATTPCNGYDSPIDYPWRDVGMYVTGRRFTPSQGAISSITPNGGDVHDYLNMRDHNPTIIRAIVASQVYGQGLHAERFSHLFVFRQSQSRPFELAALNALPSDFGARPDHLPGTVQRALRAAGINWTLLDISQKINFSTPRVVKLPQTRHAIGPLFQ